MSAPDSVKTQQGPYRLLVMILSQVCLQSSDCSGSFTAVTDCRGWNVPFLVLDTNENILDPPDPAPPLSTLSRRGRTRGHWLRGTDQTGGSRGRPRARSGLPLIAHRLRPPPSLPLISLTRSKTERTRS